MKTQICITILVDALVAIVDRCERAIAAVLKERPATKPANPQDR